MRQSSRTRAGAEKKLLRAQLSDLRARLKRAVGSTSAARGSRAAIQDDIDDVERKLKSLDVREARRSDAPVRINERQLRQMVREELFSRKQGVDPSAAAKSAIDAFMKALEPVMQGVARSRNAKSKVSSSLDNMRSRIEPMVQDVARYLKAQE